MLNPKGAVQLHTPPTRWPPPAHLTPAEPGRAGAMDGMVQLHTLETSPHALAAPWRAQQALQGPTRARRRAVHLQREPLGCHTTTYRCHEGRVKARPPASASAVGPFI